MTDNTAEPAFSSIKRPTGYIVGLMVILCVYGRGLTRDMNEPWIGLHDWNGAFYSQIARNLLRYPLAVHHGMPMVAMGPEADAEVRSYYARHPPILPWLMAGAMALVGESESSARCVPIIFSLANLLLLMDILRRSHGPGVAMGAGLLYAVLPLSVYYGRMVNHEPLCLSFILASVWAWDQRTTAKNRKQSATRWAVLAGMAAALSAWVDWAGGLFAVIMSLAVWRRQQQQHAADRTHAWIASTICLISVLSVATYLVRVGMGGRWSDLAAIAVSRTTEQAQVSSWAWGRHLVENLTWPVLCLNAVGGFIVWRNRRVQTQLSSWNWVTATGLIWVLAMWRQFLLHGYWMFYLGPVCCLLAAVGVREIFESVRARVGRGISGFTLFVFVFVVGAKALAGQQQLFERISYPPEEVLCWREVSSLTESTEAVLLSWSPVALERHGETELRNIIPAQLAYYLDRPFQIWPVESADTVPQNRIAVFRMNELERPPWWSASYHWAPCGRLVIGRRI